MEQQSNEWVVVVHTAVAATGTAAAIHADAGALIEAHDHVLNAILQKMHDSTFVKYMDVEHVDRKSVV